MSLHGFLNPSQVIHAVSIHAEIFNQVIRILELPPAAKPIDWCFEKFRDEKDSIELTLTHAYLLVGVALPLWLHPNYQSARRLNLASGLITIGFGDTAAAIVGSNFGKHRWNGSRKTVEGTLSAIVAQVIGSFLTASSSLTPYDAIVVFIAAVIVSIIEGKTSQIDNLILPLYHYILMALLL